MRVTVGRPFHVPQSRLCNYCAEECVVNKLVNTSHIFELDKLRIVHRDGLLALWRCEEASAGLQANKGNDTLTSTQPAPRRGGAETAPPSTFRNISQSVADSATKLSVPLPTSILHKLTKGCFKGYDMSAENDVRVTSCSAILDLKKGFAGRRTTPTVSKLEENFKYKKDAK